MVTSSSSLGDFFFSFSRLLVVGVIDFKSLYLFSNLITNNRELNWLKITLIYHSLSPGVRMVEMGLRRLKPKGQPSCIPFGDSGENAFPGLCQLPMAISTLSLTATSLLTKHITLTSASLTFSFSGSSDFFDGL